MVAFAFLSTIYSGLPTPYFFLNIQLHVRRIHRFLRRLTVYKFIVYH